MGYRTVVILSNDRASEWEKDPELGFKIFHAMHHAGKPKGEFDGGRVVECVHADTQTLAVIDSLGMTALEHKGWTRDESTEERDLKLLKYAAERLGYRLTKIPAKKEV